MRKLDWLAVVVLIVGLATTALWAQPRPAREPAPTPAAQTPPAGGPGGRFSEMSEAERAKMRAQMMEQMIERAGLTNKEKVAAKQALKAKDQARQGLTAELANLRSVASKQKPTDTELRTALTAYRAAVKHYRKQVEAADLALAKRLSLKSQVRCMALGILDNGLRGMGRRGEMGAPGGGSGQR